MIPYGHQDVDQTDIDAVVEILRSDFLTQGPVVPRFEQAVAAHCGAKHAVAVNSGTSALHVACLALGLRPGDVLWTVPTTFVASANCAQYCGAGVDFVDIDKDTWNISVTALREKLIRAKREGRLPKVVVPVHLSGHPTEQEAIWNLAQEFGFKVLEDAAHSFGASRNGEPVGSCKWSHIAAFSFHPVKIITTGEGGMALTNDDELAWRMATFRSHGITHDPRRMQQKPAGPWYYEQVELGYNYRMTDIHAALGASQLKRVRHFVERRNHLAQRYDALLQKLPITLQRKDAGIYSSFHLYAIRLKLDSIGKTHREVFEALRAAGIHVNLHYMPVHLQPWYRKLGFKPGDFPEAEQYSREAITLPLFYGLSDQDQDSVVATLTRILT